MGVGVGVGVGGPPGPAEDARHGRVARPGALLLEPNHVPRVWGSETWLADGASRVAAGEYQGAAVAELASEFGAALVGNESYARYGPRLALLVKFLNARDDLSVQVHPDDAYALANEADTGHLGKTEAWYILAADQGAYVLRGFVRDVTPEEVRAAAEDGSLPDLLQRVPVSPGDVVVNLAGTVHAVCGGITLYEVQQSSDLTYRLFDYDRLDAEGARRELHLDKALEVADLTEAPSALEPAPAAEAGVWRRLVARPEFVLDAVLLTAGEHVSDATNERSCEIITVVAGEARLLAGDGDALPLSVGGTVLLPANLGSYELEGDGEVLRAALG